MNSHVRLLQYFLIVMAALMMSCSNTKIIGEHTSVLPLENDQFVLLVDGTGSELEERKTKNMHLIPSYMLEFDVQECIQLDLRNVSSECLRACKQAYQAAYVVFYFSDAFEKGTSLKQLNSSNDPRIYGSLIEDTYDAFHLGSLEFVLYDTESASIISSFISKSKIKGVEIRNRNDDGGTYLNPRNPNATISRARRKGIKNIEKRIKTTVN